MSTITQKKSFPLGRVVVTYRINMLTERDSSFGKELWNCLTRYRFMDWGETSEEDCPLNDLAVRCKSGRVLARYSTNSYGDIFITTEWGLVPHTTVMFADEY